MSLLSVETINRVIAGKKTSSSSTKQLGKKSSSQPSPALGLTTGGRPQAAALKLLNREQLAAKRGRLECLIFQQYSKAVGGNKAAAELVRRQVKDFVDAQGDGLVFSDEQIQALETQIRHTIAAEKLKKPAAVKRDGGDTMSLSLSLPEQSSKATTEGSKPDASSDKAAERLNRPDWSVLNAIISVQEEEAEKLTRRLASVRKNVFRGELDQQIELQRRQQEEAARRKQEQHAQNLASQAEFAKQQRAQAEERERHHELERRINEEQMQMLKARREHERELRIREERAAMDRNRLLAEEEERQRVARRERGFKDMERVKAENERNKAIRAQQKLADAEHEARLARDYAARMDREEQSRVDAFNARIEALQRSSKRFETGAGAMIKQREDEEYERTAAAVEKELRDRERRERAEAEARRAENIRSKEFNAGLIEHKRQEQVREQRERERIREADEATAESLRRKQEEDARRRRDRVGAFRSQLDEQVRVRDAAAKQVAVLNPVEALMNRSIVGTVSDKPELVSRVLEKVSPNKSDGAHVGFSYG